MRRDIPVESSFMRRSSGVRAFLAPKTLIQRLASSQRICPACGTRSLPYAPLAFAVIEVLLTQAVCLVRHEPLKDLTGSAAGVLMREELPKSPHCSIGEQSRVPKARWFLKQ